MKHKTLLKAILIPVGAIALIALLLGGTWLFVLPRLGASSDEDFTRQIHAQTVWQNTMDNRVPITALHNVMTRHMIAQNDGANRLLLIVYDGALATLAGTRAVEYPNSPIGQFAALGNLWLGYTGGATPGDQTTDTSPGFASLFTGTWGLQNGVLNNRGTLSPEVPTILRSMHEHGLRVRFSYSWRSHGTVNFRHEMEQFPTMFDFARGDAGTADSMLDAILNGYHAVLGSFESIDTWGHITGFNYRNPFYRRAFVRTEADAAGLIAAAQARADSTDENWLIILLSDHGGIGTDHGGTTLMENTIWIASNQGFF
ncbi:MAG: hypothetical protein FWB76_01705 [Oscillospiraceae bacterium]|nr:hypothetical protein [Oscillospiraceae bacterium]